MSALRHCGNSSATEDDPRNSHMDEKKRKRMISNRESARRSRMRKQKLMQDLNEELSRLQASNKAIVAKIEEITERLTNYEAQNNVLRAQGMELSDRLRFLNGVIGNGGLVLDVNNVGDPLMKPWQVSCSFQSIPASSGMFKF